MDYPGGAGTVACFFVKGVLFGGGFWGSLGGSGACYGASPALKAVWGFNPGDRALIAGGQVLEESRLRPSGAPSTERLTQAEKEVMDLKVKAIFW